jgi:hypothetical protein
MAEAQHAMTRFQLEATRNLLSAAQQVGYDMAMALHIARVTQKPPKTVAASASATAGYSIGHGLRNASAPAKKAVLTIVAKVPDAAQGSQVAATQIQAAKAAWWRHWVGTGAGLVIGGALSIPLGMLVVPAVVIGGSVGGGVDLLRARRKPNASRGTVEAA